MKRTGDSWLAWFFYLISAYLAFVSFRVFQNPLVGTLDVLPPVLAAAIVGTIGVYISSRHDRAIQRARDFKAEEICRVIGSGESRAKRFYLFLRPFSADKDMVEKNITRAEIPFDPSYFERDHVFEENLANVISETDDIVAIGRPGEGIGAGRMPSDDQSWKELVERLMGQSQNIFIVPGISDGVIWEMDTIKRRNFLARTIVVLPPRGTDVDILESLQKSLALLLISEVFMGLAIDDNEDLGEVARGGFVVIGQDGELIKKVGFKGARPGNIRKALMNTLTDRQQ